MFACEVLGACMVRLLLDLLGASVMVIENGPFIVDFPIKNGGFPMFSIAMLVYRKVNVFAIHPHSLVNPHFPI